MNSGSAGQDKEGNDRKKEEEKKRHTHSHHRHVLLRHFFLLTSAGKNDERKVNGREKNIYI